MAGERVLQNGPRADLILVGHHQPARQNDHAAVHDAHVAVKHHRRDSCILENHFREIQLDGVVALEYFAHASLTQAATAPLGQRWYSRSGPLISQRAGSPARRARMYTAEAQTLDRQNPIDWLYSLMAADMAGVDRLIHERLGSAVPLIPDLARHLVDSGGKRLRPLLTVAAARLDGYRGADHIKLAAAVEFIHTATLLHDDVVDVSALRRGKIAANVVWGNKSSVLVGDYLFSRAFQLMVEARDTNVLNVLASASAVIAEGEVLQLRSANNLATTEEDYLRVITAKTAALFAAAAEAGAMIAGGSREYVRAMRIYGHDLGIAFQLIDDAL